VQKWPGKKWGIHIGHPLRIWAQKQPAKKLGNTGACTLGALLEFGCRNDQLKDAATPAHSHWVQSETLGAELTS